MGIKLDDFLAGGNFLKGGDIHDKQPAVVEKVEVINTRLGDRLCLRLKGIETPLGLNKTNIKAMSGKHGEVPEKWTGKRITLRKVKVPNPSAGGALTDGIRIEA
jgi:hypothetical protein